MFSDGKSRSTFLTKDTKSRSIKNGIFLVAYFLSMLMAVMLLSWSCPTVDLKNILKRARVLKCLSEERTRLQELWQGWRQLHIQTIKCHGHPFDGCSLPSRLCYFLWHGSLLLDHLIGLHYPRRKTWYYLHVIVANRARVNIARSNFNFGWLCKLRATIMTCLNYLQHSM